MVIMAVFIRADFRFEFGVVSEASFPPWFFDLIDHRDDSL